MNILIKDAMLIVNTDKNVLDITHGDVAIAGNKIIKVGDKGEIPEGWTAEKIISGENKAVLPGFVNAHTHAAMTLLRSYADDLQLMKWLQEKIWPLENKLTGQDVYWGSMAAIAEMLKAGTTAFADMYFFMDDVARAVEESGIRAALSRGMTVYTAKENIPEAKAFVKRWHNTAEGRITTMLGPHAPYTTTPEYLQQVCEIADSLNVGIHIHLSETEQEVKDITEKYGLSPIKLMDSIKLFDRHVLAAHVVHVDDEEIEILKARNVQVAHNPESNMKLVSGVAPVTKLLAKGINVALGTDGAASNNNLDMFGEMRSMTLLQKVSTGDPEALPSHLALQIATSHGAKALGLKDVGVLAPGMIADIICIDYHKVHLQPMHNIIANIAYAAHASDVTHTIVNGKILVEEGKLTTLDEEKIIYNVRKSAERMTSGI